MINYTSADYSQIGIYKYESYIEKNQIYINVDFKMTKHQFSIMSNRDYYVKIFVNNKELFNFEIENKFIEDENGKDFTIMTIKHIRIEPGINTFIEFMIYAESYWSSDKNVFNRVGYYIKTSQIYSFHQTKATEDTVSGMCTYTNTDGEGLYWTIKNDAVFNNRIQRTDLVELSDKPFDDYEETVSYSSKYDIVEHVDRNSSYLGYAGFSQLEGGVRTVKSARFATTFTPQQAPHVNINKSGKTISIQINPVEEPYYPKGYNVKRTDKITIIDGDNGTILKTFYPLDFRSQGIFSYTGPSDMTDNVIIVGECIVRGLVD